MSRRRDGNLAGMADLAGMIRDNELAKVARTLQHMARIEADIARLRDSLTKRGADGDLDAARQTGMDLVWAGQVDAQIRRKLGQLAALRASHEAALSDARRAFGRAEVLSKLSEAERRGKKR